MEDNMQRNREPEEREVSSWQHGRPDIDINGIREEQAGEAERTGVKVACLFLIWVIVAAVSFSCVWLPRAYILTAALIAGAAGMMYEVCPERTGVAVPVSVLMMAVVSGQYMALMLRSYMEILTGILLASSAISLAVAASGLIDWKKVGEKHRTVAMKALRLSEAALFLFLVLQTGRGSESLQACLRGGDGFVIGIVFTGMSCLELISDLAVLQTARPGKPDTAYEWNRSLYIIMDMLLAFMASILTAWNIYA